MADMCRRSRRGWGREENGERGDERVEETGMEMTRERSRSGWRGEKGDGNVS